MKKILGVVALGLLVCSTVFAGEIKPLNKSGFIFNDGKRVKYIKDYKITLKFNFHSYIASYVIRILGRMTSI